MENGVVTDDIHYLTASEEDEYLVAQANAPLNAGLLLRGGRRCSSARRAARWSWSPRTASHYMDVSPRQMVSVATSLIPFLEHDDANRALMGANMQRQAVPLLRSREPGRRYRHGGLRGHRRR